MPISTAPKVPRDGTLTLTDGTRTFTVAYENGDCAFTREKAARIVVRDRGTIVASRKGDDPVLQFTWSCHFLEFTNGNVSLIDVLDGTTNATTASWAKKSSAHEEWNLDMSLTIEGTDHGDDADAVATFATCIFTWAFAEGEPDQINVTTEIMGGYSATGGAVDP